MASQVIHSLRTLIHIKTECWPIGDNQNKSRRLHRRCREESKWQAESIIRYDCLPKAAP